MPDKTSHRVRYAVIGQGYFSQVAVLPAFKAALNAELVALVSDDEAKLGELGERYSVEHRLGYDDIDSFLKSGLVDAVYIALPNHLHRTYTERAAAAGVHVLCEKPMALNEEDCLAMIAACRVHRVKLMIAYRLHFEAGNLAAIESVRGGKIGDPRYMNSVFSMQVREGNSRLQAKLGGGPLNDIGIYCVNAARYLFDDEPTEVLAATYRSDDPRFTEVDESVSAVLRFSNGRSAMFTASFGAADVARYVVVGTKGMLEVENAYEFASPISHTLTTGEKRKQVRRFPKRDQVAAELLYFSDCVLEDREPEPNGWEGLADVRILDAIRLSASTGRAVTLEPFYEAERPDGTQEITVKAHGKPRLVNADPPS